MTKVILLGTGTPKAEPKRSGPSVAIIVGDSVYVVDFGPGVVRRAVQAGISPSRLTRAFLTHLHSDHTVGYPDLILTPAVIGRNETLEVYGPVGIEAMTNHILELRRKVMQASWPAPSQSSLVAFGSGRWQSSTGRSRRPAAERLVRWASGGGTV